MLKYLENEKDFEKEIKGNVLIDFYADWCGPCKMLGKVIESCQDDLGIDILKVNTDKFPELAKIYGVMSIPTLIHINNTEEVNKNIGFLTEDELKEFLKKQS